MSPFSEEIFNSVRSLLAGSGLDARQADRLIAWLEQHPEKWKNLRYPATMTPEQIAVHLASLLAADLEQWEPALRFLLDYLPDHLDKLNGYHQGIFWHLKAYADWRTHAQRYPAIRYLNRSIEALERNQEHGAFAYLARVFDTKGQIAYSNGYFNEAIEDYKHALQIRKRTGERYGEALTYGNLGRLHMELGDFDLAHRYFIQDLAILDQDFPHHARPRAQLLSHCGACLFEKGMIAQARDLYHQSLDLCRQENLPGGWLYALIGLGRVALAEGRVEEAELYRDEAQRRMEDNGGKDFLGELPRLVHHLSGMIHHVRGQLPEALDAFERGYASIRQTGQISRVRKIFFLIDYAHLTRQLNLPEKTAVLLQEALQHLDSTSAEALRRQIEEELRREHHQAWLYHSIRRFTGQEQVVGLFEAAGQPGFSGETREVALLFADVRNFTGISECVSPKELVGSLNDFLARMIRSVTHFSGYIDKILGDAVLAVFSLPFPQAGDAERALLTALMMREELTLFNSRLPVSRRPWAFGVGIHFGEVVAGLIGSPLKRSYTVIGDAANTASRLEGMTKTLGGSILTSTALIDRIAEPERYLFRPLGRFRPRGRRDAIFVWEVAGENDRSPDSLRIRSEIEQAEEVLARFHSRDFGRAANEFLGLFERTGFPAYHHLRQAATRFLANPPADDWQGEVDQLAG